MGLTFSRFGFGGKGGGGGGGGTVVSVTDDGNGVVVVDNTVPSAPVIGFNGVFVDGVTIKGNGTVGSPLYADPAAIGAWLITGNSGINPATNFFGTTDTDVVPLRLQNIDWGRWDYANDIVSFGNLSGSLSSGVSNNYLGNRAGRKNTGSYNNFIGLRAGYDLTGDLGQSGSYINAFGFNSANQNTADIVNAFGPSAALQNTGTRLNAFGEQAGRGNTGARVNALGYRAGYLNNQADANFFGENAGNTNTGTKVNFFGNAAGSQNSGTDVNGIGDEAGKQASGSDANYMGNNAGEFNSGSHVNFLGYYAGNGNTASHVNAMGRFAGFQNSGTDAYFYGNNAGFNNTFDNVIGIGLNAAPLADNEFAIGPTISRINFTLNGKTPGYVLTVDPTGTYADWQPTATPTAYTVDNGLSASTATNFQLGGSLIKTTTITSTGFPFNIVSNVNGNALSVINSSAFLGSTAVRGEGYYGVFGVGTQGGVRGTSINNAGVQGLSTNGVGGTFETTGSWALEAVTTAVGIDAARLFNNSTTNNAVEKVLRLVKQASGAVNGIGAGLEYYVADDNGPAYFTNSISSIWTNVTHASRTSQLEIRGVNNAISARLLALTGPGQLILDKYGLGTFTGTSAFYLAVTATGEVIEVSGPGSGLTLETNGVANGSQVLLNQIEGSYMSITDDGVGGVTFDVVNILSDEIVGINQGTGTVSILAQSDNHATNLTLSGWDGLSPVNIDYDLKSIPGDGAICEIFVDDSFTVLSAGGIGLNVLDGMTSIFNGTVLAGSTLKFRYDLATTTWYLISYTKTTAPSSAGINQLTQDVTAGPGSGSQPTTLKTNLRVGSFGVNAGNGQVVLIPGQVGYWTAPYDGVITGWAIQGNNASGTVQFDVWKASGTIPTISNSIVGSGTKPYLSSEQYRSEAATFDDLTFSAGDVFGFYIDSSPSPSILVWAALQIFYNKS